MGATFSSVLRARRAGAEEDEAPSAAPDREQRKSWPELVDCGAIDAASLILKDRPEVCVYFYDYGKDAPPTGFDPKRVVIFRNSGNRVVKAPTLG
ncbi:hypothetical protein TRIUR3_04230 [Triticum urartu]|uniref:Uncharacterized protein n=1 Tax=Triticum urartu TaxID=4572 RepID=M7Z450_TRIUA|nr:hypothetical protein TRIUR3_04230 [Triticum urartu]